MYKQNNYDKLKPPQIQIISRNIASKVYNSIKTKDLSSYHNALLSLQRLCINNTNHYNLNETNWDCFLETLKPVITHEKSEEIDDIINAPNILDYIRNLHTFHNHLLKHQNIIKGMDQNRCTFESVNQNVNANQKKCALLHNSIENLQKICGEARPVLHKDKGILLNDHQIGLVYTCLNLKTPIGNEIVCCILHNWVAEQSSEQIVCLKYMWENLDTVDVSVQAVLMANFSFIIEKMLITVCTKALQSNDSDSVPVYINRLFNLCKVNDRLCCTVRNVIYTLFLYSGYNNKLLSLFNKVMQ